MAALCSEVWQKRKRTSLRDFVNAYLVAMMKLGSEMPCNWIVSSRLVVWLAAAAARREVAV